MARTAAELYELALDLRAAGKLEDAIAAARTAVREHNDHAESWHLLGASLLALGESDDEHALSRAKDAYRERIAAAGEDAEVWYQLACVHALLHEDSEALACLKTAFALDRTFQSHELRSRASNDEDLERLLDGGNALDRLLPELTGDEERARLYAFFARARIAFEPVERFDYYLANAIGSRFMLRAERVADAHQRLTAFERAPPSSRWPAPAADPSEAALRRRTEAVAAKIERAKRTGKATLDQVFAAYFMTLVRDDAGNIIDIVGQNGDVAAVGMLEGIADLIEDGSWFLYLDDVGRYWRARIDHGRIVYELGRALH